MNGAVDSTLVADKSATMKVEKQKYKCHTCFHIVEELPCPNCGETELKPMCPGDHLCTCLDEVTDGLQTCPTCGEFTCKCGCHDVVVMSRITGYYSDVAGWNAGKRAELVQRTRYDPFSGQVLNH